MATSRPYGGLKSGSSRGPSMGVIECSTRFMSERGCSDRVMPITDSLCTDGTYRIPVSGSTAAPPQSAPPTTPGICSVPRVPPGDSSTSEGAVKSGPLTYCSKTASASCRSSGVKSIRSSTLVPCWSKGGGFVGNGWVAAYHSPGTSPGGTGRSSMGQIGSPVTRSKT